MQIVSNDMMGLIILIFFMLCITHVCYVIVISVLMIAFNCLFMPTLLCVIRPFCDYISIDLQSWHCPSVINICQYYSYTFCFISNRSFASFFSLSFRLAFVNFVAHIRILFIVCIVYLLTQGSSLLTITPLPNL